MWRGDESHVENNRVAVETEMTWIGGTPYEDQKKRHGLYGRVSTNVAYGFRSWAEHCIMLRIWARPIMLRIK